MLFGRFVSFGSFVFKMHQKFLCLLDILCLLDVLQVSNHSECLLERLEYHIGPLPVKFRDLVIVGSFEAMDFWKLLNLT